LGREGQLISLWRRLSLSARAYRVALPLVRRELEHWRRRAEAIPDPELRTQALLSLHHKAFHCEGGGLYAVGAPRLARPLVRYIVALQTISDYLDNLCDRDLWVAGRSGGPAAGRRAVLLRARDLRRLHRAMWEAVSGPALPGRDRPGNPGGAVDFYRYRTAAEDGGYLAELVATCRRAAAELPGYPAARPAASRLVRLYAQFQVAKHLPPPMARRRLEAWFTVHRRRGIGPWVSPAALADLGWWEFAAAAGSTVGVFALALAATRADLDPGGAARVVEACFPWLCALHILLDYYIDQAEDRHGGDLNLVSHYPPGTDVGGRLAWLADRAHAAVRRLPPAELHAMMVHGLPAIYLSDPKVRHQGLEADARRLLARGGLTTRAIFAACRLARARGHLRSAPQPPAGPVTG